MESNKIQHIRYLLCYTNFVQNKWHKKIKIFLVKINQAKNKNLKNTIKNLEVQKKIS